jgi:hypothetical protein
MSKFSIDLPIERRIEINEESFALKLPEHEVAAELHNVVDVLGGLTEGGDSGVVVAAVRQCIGCVDKALGSGAVEKISKGRPVGALWIIRLAGLLADAIREDVIAEAEQRYE